MRGRPSAQPTRMESGRPGKAELGRTGQSAFETALPALQHSRGGLPCAASSMAPFAVMFPTADPALAFGAFYFARIWCPPLREPHGARALFSNPSFSGVRGLIPCPVLRKLIRPQAGPLLLMRLVLRRANMQRGDPPFWNGRLEIQERRGPPCLRPDWKRKQGGAPAILPHFCKK